jgi:hypothetical protein
MIWLTWRQFRAQAAAGAAAVGVCALVLAITGPRLADLARLNASVFDHLSTTDHTLFYAGIVALALAPALIGAFWGAPLVARELEDGTQRLAWTQSVTRTRWLATKLGLIGLSAAAVTGLLTWAVTWWADPIDGAASATRGSLPSRLTPVTFAMRGIAPVGYAVFAVVLGVTLGILVRRTAVAMVLTLAVYTAIQIAMPIWVRPHLIPPAQENVTISRGTLDGIYSNAPGAPVRLSVRSPGPGDWVLSDDTVDARGRSVALPAWMSECLPPPPDAAVPGKEPVKGSLSACLDRLTAEGYRQHVVYQPASRFWALQWAETALFLVLSGILAGLSLWWLRRRLV